MLGQELIWTFTVSALIFAVFIVAHLFVEGWCLWKIFVMQMMISTISSLSPGMEVNKAIAQGPCLCQGGWNQKPETALHFHFP